MIKVNDICKVIDYTHIAGAGGIDCVRIVAMCARQETAQRYSADDIVVEAVPIDNQSPEHVLIFRPEQLVLVRGTGKPLD